MKYISIVAILFCAIAANVAGAEQIEMGQHQSTDSFTITVSTDFIVLSECMESSQKVYLSTGCHVMWESYIKWLHRCDGHSLCDTSYMTPPMCENKFEQHCIRERLYLKNGYVFWREIPEPIVIKKFPFSPSKGGIVPPEWYRKDSE